jgi:DNA-binding LacI/PurR family transcriptional regulator
MAYINRKAGLPSYLQLRNILREKIRGMEAGANLPTIRELMNRHHISQATVEKALFQLEQEELVYREQGRGTFVGRKDEKGLEKSSPVGRRVRSNLLGLIVPTRGVSFFSDIIFGVEEAAGKNGYHVILCNANEDPGKEKEHVLELLKRDLSGLVVVAGKNSHPNGDFFQKISLRVPLVMMDVFLEGVEADYVASDDRKGSYEAVKHLLELGHRRILHLAGLGEDSTAVTRYEGYKDALFEQGIEFDASLVREAGWKHARGYLEMKKFLINNRKGATAVFACNDEVASGAFKAIRERGLKVPEEMALVGFGNLDIGLLLEVPLTTVDQLSVETGAKATGLLLERIKRKNIPFSRKVITPTRLVVRESCGAKLIGVEST